LVALPLAHPRHAGIDAHPPADADLAARAVVEIVAGHRLGLGGGRRWGAGDGEGHREGCAAPGSLHACEDRGGATPAQATLSTGSGERRSGAVAHLLTMYLV